MQKKHVLPHSRVRGTRAFTYYRIYLISDDPNLCLRLIAFLQMDTDHHLWLAFSLVRQ